MQGFLKALRESDGKERLIAAAVITGAYAGSRLLLADGTVVWESMMQDTGSQDLAGREPDGWKAYIQELAASFRQLPDCGIYKACGGDVFCEVPGKEKKLVICGGGHVSVPLIQIGRLMGCFVTVLEDRPQFADNARRAGASEVFCGAFAEGLARIQGDADTYFVIVTRGHRYDKECLLHIAGKKHAYIGMIGSRRRAAAVKEAAIGQGADRAVVAGVYTPIGLDIGAKTPEEIAVAVAAQIIQVKNQSAGSTVNFPKEIMDAVLDEANAAEPKVLATIIRRSGSAPREEGAKMLVLADGTCIGTIGGGCAEADMQKKAMLLIREGKAGVRLCHTDMAADTAQEEGMVCGGAMDVLLECFL